MSCSVLSNPTFDCAKLSEGGRAHSIHMPRVPQRSVQHLQNQGMPSSWHQEACFLNLLLQVLDTFLYADRHLLQQQPELASAEVYVHFNSSDEVRWKTSCFILSGEDGCAGEFPLFLSFTFSSCPKPFLLLPCCPMRHAMVCRNMLSMITRSLELQAE